LFFGTHNIILSWKLVLSAPTPKALIINAQLGS
jgi:hypothetical protein